jgi:hypothetical protein
MEQVPSNEDRFKANLIELLGYIHKLCRHMHEIGKTEINPIAISLAIQFVNGYDKVKLLDTYIRTATPFWDKIKARDENYFRDNSRAVFGPLPFENVNKYIFLFSKLFEEKDENGDLLITDVYKNAIWSFHEAFVKISIKQVHFKRCPKVILVNEVKTPIYSKKYAEEISLKDFLSHAQKWSIELVFK